MVEDSEVIVVGAGPSGLAVSACLRRQGTPFVVLEQAAEVGSTWRRHYERLHLHTIKHFSALPHQPWPDNVPLYPSRAQVVDYLERYAERFSITPRFGEAVKRAAREGGAWQVETGERAYRARALVIATGYNRIPKVPSWPGQERFRGVVIHSSAYKNGAAFRGKRALVVGIGNSGGEIAIDLWEHGAETTLAVRSPVHVIPRDLYGIPAQINSLFFLGRFPPEIADRIALPLLDKTVGDLSRWGLRRPDIGPASQVIKRGRIPLVDIGTVELIKQGQIRVTPGPREFTENGVVFTDGRELPFDLVVLATGYHPAIADYLEGAEAWLDERGHPRWHGTEVAAAPGLFFIGYRNPITGQLHDIAQEAVRIAGQIAAPNPARKKKGLFSIFG